MCASALLATAARAQDRWDAAALATKRLAPAAFARIPEPIRAELVMRRCTVPQDWAATKPVNVVFGDFTSPTATDIAVLCSADRASRILVFVGQRADSVLEMAAEPDKNYLQGVGGDSIGFSRGIRAVSAVQMRRYLGHACPDVTRHGGIEDTFIEKASSVLYWCKGKWLKLAGAD